MAVFHKGSGDNCAVALMSSEEMAAQLAAMHGALGTGLTAAGNPLATRFAWRLQELCQLYNGLLCVAGFAL